MQISKGCLRSDVILVSNLEDLKHGKEAIYKNIKKRVRFKMIENIDQNIET